MTKLVTTVTGVTALLIVGTALAVSAATDSYKATLTVKAEVPAPDAPAKAAGNFSATVTEKKGATDTIRWTLTFRRLSGKAVAAHIHKAAVGVPGPVVLTLCSPCRNGQNGRVPITDELADALAAGASGYYVNVHTVKNAGGEIRGQLKLLAG